MLLRREKETNSCIAVRRDGLGLEPDHFRLVVPQSKLHFLLPSWRLFESGDFVGSEWPALVFKGGYGRARKGLQVAWRRCGQVSVRESNARQFPRLGQL